MRDPTERVPTDEAELALARHLFDAYNEAGHVPWKTWDGKDVPQWPELGMAVQVKWLAVAARALQLVGGR